MLVALKASAPPGPRAGISGAGITPDARDVATPPFPLLAEDRAAQRMSNPHRGLPPLTSLATDSRQPQAPPPPPPPSTALTTTSSSNAYMSQPLGQLPEAPRPSQGSDDAMRNWLSTKAEEEKRRQEEERTKQEGLKLEQRKIEQSMLRESIQAGVPAPMVPMVFAGMGGSEVAKASLDWAQHYMSQMSLQQPNQNGNGADARRDGRTMPGPQANPYASQQPAALPVPPHPPPPSSANAGAVQPSSSSSSSSHAMQQPGSTFGTPYQQQSQDAARFRFQQPQQQQQQQQEPGSVHTNHPPTLSRLITGGTRAEMHIPQPPPGGMPMPTQQAQQPPPPPRPQGPNATPQQQNNNQQPHQGQQQHNSSPGIYFHHWTPPNKEPATPNKSTHTSPYASHAISHLRHEYTSSPKKRRTGGSGGGSVGDKNSENGTANTSPHEGDSPRFEVLRPGDVAAQGARKRGLSNVTNVTNVTRGGESDRQSSVGPGDRKRTLSGTPKAEVEVSS